MSHRPVGSIDNKESNAQQGKEGTGTVRQNVAI